MKKQLTKRMGTALLSLLLMSATATAQTTTLASWTFDTGYDVADNVYTPNTADYTEIDTQWFNAGQPVIIANETVGTASDYVMTGKTSRYWTLCNGYNNQVFRIVNDTEANNISDYTDVSQHDNYYEVQFPTTGYTNIKVEFACAYGGNAAATIIAVISTDNGANWIQVGQYTTASNWWIYNKGNLNLSASNKSKVILRLIFGNGFTSNWNLDYLTVTGEAASSFAEMHTLTTSVYPAGAGSITRSPAAAEYEENSVVSLTAAANVGYAFKEWQDGAGNTLSTENPYNATITSATTINAIFKVAPLPVGTETTIVKWDFNNPYTVSDNIYIPTEGDFAQTSLNTSSILRPNYYFNSLNSTSSIMEKWTSEGGQYLIRYNYQNDDQRCLGLVNTSNSNAISDYTDASQHDGYFEVNFCTVDFEDVAISFTGYRNANGGAGSEPAYHVAYSVNDGTTWVDAGESSISGYWWIGTKVNPSVAIDNKTNVKVRIFPNNGHLGYWYIDDVTVTGKVMARSITVSDAGYATYYNDCAVEIPAGLTAYWGKLSSDGTKLELTEITDGIIPAETAVVVKGVANTYSLTATAEEGSTYAENALRGVVAETAVSDLALGTGTVYVLAKAASTGKAAFCEFQGTKLGDHRAYLFVAGAGARTISFDFGEATAIEDISNTQVCTATIYNLRGLRIAQPTHGLYIQNGKKVVR